MTIIERANQLKQLWDVTLTPCPSPKPSQLMYWADRYSDDLLQKAFVTTAVRIELNQEPTVVHKYVSGLARNLQREVA